VLQILDLNNKNIWDIACFCLRNPEKEDWYIKGDKRRIQEAWKRKYDFLVEKLREGARGKLAYVDGTIVGFIEYYPIEITNLEIVGKDIMAIWCINVKEEDRGIGVGGKLLEACLDDSKKSGYKGVVVTCWDPLWMPSGFFKEYGFMEVGKAVGNGKVLFKTFEDVENPRWIGRGSTYEDVKKVDGKVAIDIFHTDRCPIHWRNTALIRELAAEFGDKVEIHEYNTDNRADMLEHGIGYSVYLDGKLLAAGPQVKKGYIIERIREKLGKFET